MRKPSKTYLRNKADKLLQDYIRAKHKGVICCLCGEVPISVGHHFIYKSQSNATRYYLPNIIPLCRDCHCLIHSQPSMQNAKVTLQRGQVWFDDLEDVKRLGVKANLEWYKTQINIFQELLNSLTHFDTDLEEG